MITNSRERIMSGIMRKGGLLGNCAKLYINDEIMAHNFIIECSEQCHLQLATEYWGKKLIIDILSYSEAFKVNSELKHNFND